MPPRAPGEGRDGGVAWRALVAHPRRNKPTTQQIGTVATVVATGLSQQLLQRDCHNSCCNGTVATVVATWIRIVTTGLQEDWDGSDCIIKQVTKLKQFSRFLRLLPKHCLLCGW